MNRQNTTSRNTSFFTDIELNEVEHLLLHIFYKITPWGLIISRLEEHQTIKT